MYKRQIYEAVWAADGEHCGTAVASVIGQIRRKLTPDTPKGGYIRTVLGLSLIHIYMCIRDRTTSQQIKRLVNRQALYLFLMGTPFGLLFGILLGRSILPAALQMFAAD